MFVNIRRLSHFASKTVEGCDLQVGWGKNPRKSQRVAAPDHNIGQCIQRSALFPGRADGGTRFAGGAKRRGGRFGKGAVAPLH